MKRVSYPFVVIVLSIVTIFLLTFSPFTSSAETINATKEPVEIYNPFYVGVFGGFVVPDELKVDNGPSIKLNNSWAAGVKAGYIFPVRWLAAELEYMYLHDQDVYEPGTEYYKSNNLMVNLLLRYPEGMIRPYIGLGAGWSMGEIAGGSLDESFNNYAVQGIAGINLEIIPSLSIDFGYRYFFTECKTPGGDATLGDHILSVGLNYHFGGVKLVPPPPPPPPEPVPVKKCQNVPECCIVDADGCPTDSDKDGVCDGCDKCPDTPEGCVVDENGCPVDSDKDGVCDGRDKCPDTPLGCVVDENGCPKDSDKDGVCDGLDKCPNTPPGCAVDENGCPVDSDKDGVPDCLDKCPDTPEVAKVDKNGCPITAVITLMVQFDYKKWDIKSEYYGEIKKLADFMKKHPNLKATIEGHTCNIASAQYNLELSRKRAESIKKSLIEMEDIDPKRLKAVGFGLTKPIAGNDTEEGRIKNRRVEVHLEVQELRK
ncbi:Outer membrane protein A precursor [Smithella sp. ME-1]|uniref:Outer membrane protein a n=1 Tax=hydrocarbon metagenome TaxID=938273 RepID=A0A0W8FNM8_9ZZZZ|nr:Outer membrane protein A precursor [Smithella sp. ME-1]